MKITVQDNSITYIARIQPYIKNGVIRYELDWEKEVYFNPDNKQDYYDSIEEDRFQQDECQ